MKYSLLLACIIFVSCASNRPIKYGKCDGPKKFIGYGQTTKSVRARY